MPLGYARPHACTPAIPQAPRVRVIARRLTGTIPSVWAENLPNSLSMLILDHTWLHGRFLLLVDCVRSGPGKPKVVAHFAKIVVPALQFSLKPGAGPLPACSARDGLSVYISTTEGPGFCGQVGVAVCDSRSLAVQS